MIIDITTKKDITATATTEKPLYKQIEDSIGKIPYKVEDGKIFIEEKDLTATAKDKIKALLL
jgi:hypothetical protein